MRDPYALLGLPRDADERAIKRAYAQRLRTTRPDDDPAGFQRLNEAYQRCLALAANRHVWRPDGDEDERDDKAAGADAGELAVLAGARGDAVAEASADAIAVAVAADLALAAAEDAPEPEYGSFDTDAFLDDLLDHVQCDTPAMLDRWLRGLVPLYSLELKQAVRTPVARALIGSEPRPPPQQLRVAMRFFDLDGVSADGDWLQRSLQQILTKADEVVELEREIAELRSPRAKPIDFLLMRELLGPRHWGRRLFVLLIPLLPSRLNEMRLALESDYPNAIEARLDPESVAFWHRATDRNGFDWRRLLIAPLRMPLYYAAMMAFVALLTASTAPFQKLGHHSLLLAVAVLGWTLSSTAIPRIARYFQRERGWDPALLHSAVLFACGFAASPWWPVAAIALFVVVGLAWTAPRPLLTQWLPAFFAMATGAIAVFVSGLALQGGDSASTPVLIATGAYAGAVPILHDVFNAWRKRIGLHEARRRLGGLWWLVAAHVLAATTLPVWIPLLRGWFLHD